MKSLFRFLLGAGSVFALLGCPLDGGVDDAGASDAGDVDAGSSLLCDIVEPACTDTMIQQLSLHTTISTGDVTTTESGGVFTTVIDASAGGMSGANNKPFVYVKFETDGAVKVSIDDESALTSADWDLAARRFVVRLNSGDSGPSCVLVAPSNDSFDTVTPPPSNAYVADDAFYNESCNYITDDRFQGFDGPNTELKSFWGMNGMCVSTSGQVFVLKLADGRYLKLVIDAYYRSNQDECNNNGNPGNGSGVLTLRWAWLS